MDEHEILVPTTKIISIGDKQYIISKLTLLQIIKIGKLLSRTILSSQAKIRKIQESTKDSSSNAGDLMTIIDLLEEDDLICLFCLILTEHNTEFIKTNLTFDTSVEIIRIVAEQNGIEGIKNNFFRLGELIKKGK